LRISVAFRNRVLSGGIETYLQWVICALLRARHEVAFLFEQDRIGDRERMIVPSGVASFCVAELGSERAIAAVRDWKPDLVFNNGLSDIKLEKELVKGFSVVYYAHGFHGACISGHKAFARPNGRPCHKTFGLQCLAHYFPRRCGGLNPVTMLSLYSEESDRLALLRHYKAIVTNSDYVRNEYLHLGLETNSVERIYYPSICLCRESEALAPTLDTAGRKNQEAPGSFHAGAGAKTWQLVFVGRMMPQKGVNLLLDALPRAASVLDRRLRLLLAGDGPACSAFESHARRVQDSHPSLKIEFLGWLDAKRLQGVIRNSDLLVVPSWYPEPFGLVGPEAGLHGVPAAAFAVGGIPEWLVDGVNGHLAPGEPPTAAGLAEALTRCLRDPVEHERLRQGALELARSFTPEKHMNALLEIFEKVVGVPEEASTVI